MFLILGQVVKDRVTERVNKSKFFGCLVDEVTDVSVLQQFVTFVKYVYEGKSRTEFLHTEHLSKATGKALAESLEGILEKCSLDISKMKCCVSDGAPMQCLGYIMEWSHTSKRKSLTLLTFTVSITGWHWRVSTRAKN